MLFDRLVCIADTQFGNQKTLMNRRHAKSNIKNRNYATEQAPVQEGEDSPRLCGLEALGRLTEVPAKKIKVQKFKTTREQALAKAARHFECNLDIIVREIKVANRQLKKKTSKLSKEMSSMTKRMQGFQD